RPDSRTSRCFRHRDSAFRLYQRAVHGAVIGTGDARTDTGAAVVSARSFAGRVVFQGRGCRMSSPDRVRFHGIYPSFLCPLRADFSVDEATLARHVADVTAVPGIAGVLCPGEPGENAGLGGTEQRPVVEVCRDAVGAGRLVVAGINHESSLAAADLARDAAAAGADAVMVFAPYSWALAQDEHLAHTHHRIVGAAMDLPMMLFQGSVRAGRIPYTPAVLRALV